MKIKVTNEAGQKIQLTISDEEYAKLFPPQNKTGYEKATTKNNIFYYDNGVGFVSCSSDLGVGLDYDNNAYIAANYYTDKTVSENNARADKLMRQLRRFAVEHREKELNWKSIEQDKYYIVYDNNIIELIIGEAYKCQTFGTVYFDSRETAQLAIDTFKDELLWYFTEYKDSL